MTSEARDPLPQERDYFHRIGLLLSQTEPEVGRQGVLDKILLPSGWMCRNAGGKLRVYPTSKSLSNDSVLNRSRRKSREPDESELARWKQVQKILERTAPSVGRDGTLSEILLPYGTMRRGPFGLVVYQERLEPVSVTVSREMDDDGLAAPAAPEEPEPAPVEDSWRDWEPTIPIAIPVRERGMAQRNADNDLYGDGVVRGYATPRGGQQALLRKKAREYAAKHSCPMCRQPLRHSLHEKRIHARTALRGGPIRDLSLSGHQRKLWLKPLVQSQLAVSPSFVPEPEPPKQPEARRDELERDLLSEP